MATNPPNRSAAAAWLRDHAGPGVNVKQVDRGTQTVMLEVQTQGWPTRAPLDVGQVSFSLRPYDASGRPFEIVQGDGSDGRVLAVWYDDHGRPEVLTDALGRRVEVLNLCNFEQKETKGTKAFLAA